MQFFLDQVDLQEELALLDEAPDPAEFGGGQLAADLGELQEEHLDLVADGFGLGHLEPLELGVEVFFLREEVPGLFRAECSRRRGPFPGRFEDVEEDVLAFFEVIQSVPASHRQFGPVQELAGGIIARVPARTGPGGLQGEVHGRGADDESGGEPGQSRFHPEREQPGPRPRGRQNALGLSGRGKGAVGDHSGKRLPIHGGDRPADLGLDGFRFFQDPSHLIGRGPAFGALFEMFGHRRSPSSLQVTREEGHPIVPFQRAFAHRCIPKSGVSHFLRFWTALKWSDLAVPTEIRMASEISLN